MTFIRKMAVLTLSAATLLTVPAGAAEASLHAKSPAVAPTPVPSPSHAQLMLIGLGLVLLFGRRQAVRTEPWRNN